MDCLSIGGQRLFLVTFECSEKLILEFCLWACAADFFLQNLIRYGFRVGTNQNLIHIDNNEDTMLSTIYNFFFLLLPSKEEEKNI